MSRSVDETRREFLLRLAKGAAFVPPALLTLDVTRAFGQKGPTTTGTGATSPTAGGTGTGDETAAATTTGVSPPGGALRAFSVEREQSAEPWDPGRSAGSPPWSKPPPTQTGR